MILALVNFINLCLVRMKILFSSRNYERDYRLTFRLCRVFRIAPTELSRLLQRIFFMFKYQEYVLGKKCTTPSPLPLEVLKLRIIACCLTV